MAQNEARRGIQNGQMTKISRKRIAIRLLGIGLQSWTDWSSITQIRVNQLVGVESALSPPSSERLGVPALNHCTPAMTNPVMDVYTHDANQGSGRIQTD